MKLSRILPRFVPFVVTLSLGIAATLNLRNEQQPASIESTVTSPFRERRGSGSSSHGQNNHGQTDWRYHDFNRPFLPRLSPTEKSEGLKIIYKPRAAYTDQARVNGVEGRVRLKVVLLASGNVGGIDVVNGLPDGLTEQAFDAARRIKFTPATVDGRPLSKTVKIDYRFEIY